MADISDERLEELVHWSSNDGYGGMPDTHKALLELQRHRATMQLALEYGDLAVAHMETLLSYVTNGLSPARELLPEIRSLVAEILRHRAARSRSNRMKDEMADLGIDMVHYMGAADDKCEFSLADVHALAAEVIRHRAAKAADAERIELTESERCNLFSIRAVLAGKRPLFNAEIMTLDRLLGPRARQGAKP